MNISGCLEVVSEKLVPQFAGFGESVKHFLEWTKRDPSVCRNSLAKLSALKKYFARRGLIFIRCFFISFRERSVVEVRRGDIADFYVHPQTLCKNEYHVDCVHACRRGSLVEGLVRRWIGIVASCAESVLPQQ